MIEDICWKAARLKVIGRSLDVVFQEGTRRPGKGKWRYNCRERFPSLSKLASIKKTVTGDGFEVELYDFNQSHLLLLP